MFELTKKFRFEAAHRLPHHDGKCARLHGHSWNGAVIVRGPALQKAGPKQGMLLDFGEISKPVNELVESKLDHHFLNDTLPLSNPTSEEVARWMFNELKPRLPDLVAVVIEETCTSACRYEETQSL